MTQTPVPTDDELKLALMSTTRLHHQLLTVGMTALRLVLVGGGMVVAVRVADHLVR